MNPRPSSDPAAPRIPLTPAQRGIWYAQRLDPDNAGFQIGQYLDLEGPVDTTLLGLALRKAVTDLESLHLRFAEDADGPYAVPRPPGPRTALLTEEDLSLLDTRAARERAEARMDEEMTTARDIEGDDLVAGILFRLPGQRSAFFLRAHHVLIDGYSAVIALRYVARTYSLLSRALPGGRMPRRLAGPAARVLDRLPSALPSLDTLAREEEEYRASARHAEDRAHWESVLSEELAADGLEGTPDGIAARVVRVEVPLGAERSARLSDLDRDLPKTLVAAVAVYLSRMTGTDVVPVGLPVTARRGRIARTTPSMLSSVLPLRIPVAPSDTLERTVHATGDVVRSAVAHQRFRVEELPTAPSRPGPSVNLLPVVDDLRLGAATGTVRILSTGPVRDLSIVLSDPRRAAAPAVLRLEGDAALHTAESLRTHGERLLRVLDAVLADPGTAVGAVSLLGDEEQRSLLAAGRGADAPAAQDGSATVVDVARGALARRAGHRAVVAADGERTFAELDQDADRLARHLRGAGVGRGDRVAVRVGRTVDLPALVLGILRAGAVYVPLDPAYPVERVSDMLEAACPALLLTSAQQRSADVDEGADWNVPTEVVDTDTAPWRRAARHGDPLPSPAPGDLAYVIFTSGSTGRPKGVAVEHDSLHALLQHHRSAWHEPAALRLGRPVRAAHTAGLSFDASWDPLLWLFSGHELHLIEDEVRRDPERLAEHLERERIDAVETTPSFAEALVGAGMLEREHHPSEIALGGEAVGDALWERLAAHDGLSAVNLYGPTESTVDSLIAPITVGTGPHLGDSVAGSRHYVLDAALAPVPDRGIGELYLAGRGVARGYVGRPDLDAQRFVADPFAADGSRMYRTGDLVRRRHDGTLRFLGRLDDQVKIRGHRVETGEVETALARQDGVTAAAVVAHGEGASARLLGYVTTAGEAADPAIADAARDALRAQLPDYMVPAVVMPLPAIPLTANGKVDRAALPAPGADRDATAFAPSTPTERIVAQVLTAVLERPDLGGDEDFFAAGGHSLLATRAAARLGEELDRSVTVRDVFEHPSIRGLARALGDAPVGVAPTRPERGPRPDPLPLSPNQRRLWFLHRLDPDSAAYSVPLVLELVGTVDVPALRAALGDVIARHEPLRTLLPVRDGEPVQEVLEPDRVPDPLLAVEVPVDRVADIVRGEAVRPFDLEAEVPVRAVLLRTDAEHATLALTMHHIATDGWSLAPLARDLGAAYAARTDGREPDLAPLSVDFADAALWHRERLGAAEDPDSERNRLADFWRRTLDGAPPETALPRDRARGVADPEVPEHGGTGESVLRIDPERHARLRETAAEHGASLFLVLHTALLAALHQHGTGDDLVIGTPVAGRSDPRLDEVVGFFVNTVALRTSLDGDPTLGELLDRVRHTNTEAYAHQDLPFDQVVDAVRPPRAAGRPPLFQVMLSLQNTPPARLDLPGLEVRVPTPTTTAGVKADLLVDVTAGEGDAGPLRIALAHDRALFDGPTADRLRDTLDRVLADLVADPGTRLGALTTLEAEDAAALAAAGQGPPPPAPGTVLEVDADGTGLLPRLGTLRDAAGTLTADDLRTGAERDAVGLARHGVVPGDRVVVALPRTARAVSVLLGVLRAGAVAVPVDLAHPDARLTRVLSAATPRAVLTEDPERFRRLAAEAGAGTAGTMVLDPAELPADGTPPPPPGPEDTAYLVHTSGTTGTPKGVQVPHRALRTVLAHHERVLVGPLRERLGRAPRMLHLSGLAFDAAWDPVLWLIAGADLAVVPEDEIARADAVVSRIAADRIDVIETTPSYAAQLRGVGLEDTLRDRDGDPLVLALGGEALPAALWDAIADSDLLEGWNLYGPSEATVDALVAPVRPGEVLLGTPVDGVRAQVLDTLLRPTPPGAEGELYLSGPTLADGYRGDAARTAARFVADPSRHGERMYRTGDVVRRRADGGLRFVRRADDQVNLRGYRVETGDVEAALEREPGVGTAVVRVRAPGGPGTERVLAWVTGEVEADRVRERARAELPPYMVPAAVAVLAELPLTVNGKVDADALPDPQQRTGTGREARDGTEHALCTLIGAVLAVPRPGPEEDFFELGGHSLLAVELVGRIRGELGVQLPVRAVFDHPTAAGLAAAVGTADPEGAEDAAGAEGADRPGLPAVRDWVRAHPRPADQDIPLSADQERLWFLHRIDPGSAEYTVLLECDLEGELDVDALSGAVDDLVERHEVLRTVFPEVDGRPVQRPLPAPTGVLGTDPIDPSAGIDLTTGIPLRAALVATGPDRWRLTVAIHHIATDGASLAPLLRDLSTAYSARTGGMRPARRPLPVQFADHARHQRAVHAEDGDLQERVRSWAERLRGAPAELELPADGARGDSLSRRARTVRFTVPEADAGSLLAQGSAAGGSAFHSWLGALAAFLHRIGAGDDLVIGAPSAGRTDPDLADLVGFFVTTLPLRLRLPGGPGPITFPEVVRIARAATLEAMEDDGVPFERIVEAVGPERRPGRHPLFQTLLAVEEPSGAALDLPGVAVTRVEPDGTGAAKVDLSITLRPQPDGTVQGTLEADAELFGDRAARGLVDRWLAVLHHLASEPGTPLHAVEAGPAASPLPPWPATAGAERVLDVLEASAAADPTATAVAGPDGSLRADELLARVHGRAAGLRAAGVRPGDRVALAVRRGTDVVSGMLAVWRAGAVAVPIDVSLPEERIAALIGAAAPRVLLHTGSDEERAARRAAEDLEHVRTLRVTELDGAAEDGAARIDPPHPEDPAYLIFTSGTTGAPKAVQVPHRALDRLLASHRSTLLPPPAERRRRFAHATGIGFDASLDPLLWAVAGHEVHLTDDLVRRDPVALARFLAEHRIDTWETTPGQVDALREQADLGDLLDARDPADPFLLLLGGEPIDAGLWEWLRDHSAVRAWNLYGPTEVGVDSLVGPVDGEDGPVLGAPTPGTVARVLDGALRPVPVGSVGELWLAGPQLAHGYRGDPAATASRFVADPFAGDGSRMYRTGDLVAVRDAAPGGRAPVVSLGRSDDQVKIRGHRIEPGEVAAVLRDHPEVAQAVVRPVEGPGGTRLTAWVVPARDTARPDPTDPTGLSDRLLRRTAGRLPAALQPAAITVIDEVPLTANGKVDARALPEPALGNAGGRPPAPGTESVVAAAYAEVLAVAEVRAEDSFFDLGGHSFVIRPAVAAIGDRLGREVPVELVFRAPTVAGLAAALDAEAPAPAGPTGPPDSPSGPSPTADSGTDLEASLAPVLPLRTEGSGPPLVVIHPASGLAWPFASLLPHLDPDLPVFGLQRPGLLPGAGDDAPEATLEELLDAYLEALRSVRPEGPYRLVGYSLGGRIAHRLAARLRAAGEEVSLLAVLDAYPSEQALQGVEDGPARLRALLAAQGLPVPPGDPDLPTVLASLRDAGHPLGHLPVEVAERMTDRFARLGELLDSEPSPVLPGDLDLLVATRDVPAGRPPATAWRPHVQGELRHREIDARHADLLEEPAARSTAAWIADLLRAPGT